MSPFNRLIFLQNVGYEVRAGLSSVYDVKGWVASDIHSEAGSRTLDYACQSVIHPQTNASADTIPQMTTTRWQL